MAIDPIDVNPGKAADRVPVITDKISGNYVPIYKMAWGAEGALTLASAATPLPAGIYGESGNIAYVDPFSGAIGVLDQEHLQIHNGNGYTLGSRFVIANSGGILNILLIVPAAVFPHFRKMIVSLDGGPFDLDFFEATTVSANGTQLTAYNNNRNSSNTPGLQLYTGPTITADGNLLEPILAPGSKQSGALGSDASNEWLLKQNQKYLLRVTNNTVGAGTSRGTINSFWYEP